MKEIILEGLDEKILVDVCDNGLPIYMLVNNKISNFYITLNVKYGSKDTEFSVDGKKVKVPDGIAHYLEHVNFNTDEGETAHDIFKKMGSQINAYTTFGFTSYEVFSSTLFKENITSLLDYVQKPFFTEKLVEKERGIIIEEVKMGKNQPNHKLYYGMNRALFKKDKKRYLVTGEVSDVKKITKEQLQLVYDTFYHPKNMFIVITGCFDPKEAVKIIKENQNSKKFIDYKNPVRKEIIEPREVNKEYEEIECNVEIPRVKVCYKMPYDIFKDKDEIEIALHLNAILRNNFGSTSLLSEELLENQLVTYISSSCDIENNILVLTVRAETRYPDKIVKIIKDKMKHLEINEEDMARCRRAEVASLINILDDIEYMNSDIAYQMIEFGHIHEDIFDIYNSINYKEAKEVINKLDLNNNSTVILVPYNKG